MSVQSSVRRSGLVLVTGALAVTLAACGGGTSVPASGGDAPSNSARQPGQGAPPGAFGTVAALNGSTAQVQNAQSGQVAVTFNAGTTFTDSTTGALSDVTAGECVQVTGAAPAATGQPLAAKSVTITQAGANGCAAGGGFGGGGGGRGTGGGGGASRNPNPSRQPRPSGGNTAPAGRAFGSVTAVTATGFTAQSTNPSTKATTSVPVTVDSSTTFTKTVSATASAVVVGVCVAALGQADDTGAITAKSIAVSKPGPDGCSTGFGGGFGGGRRGGGNGNGGGGNG